MSTDVPVVPVGGDPYPPPEPAKRKSNWTLIILIAAGVLIVCTLACCIGFAAFSPQIGARSSAVLCGLSYPDLTEAECSAWADDMWTNHQAEYIQCQNSTQSSSTSGNTKPLFDCLENKGLGPRD